MKRTTDSADVVDVDIGEGIVVAIVAAVLVLVFIFFVLPVLVALIDLLLLVVLALGSLVARVLFRRPWLVDAHHSEGRNLRWRIVGWRASRDFAAEARDLLDAGIIPPGAKELELEPLEADDHADPDPDPDPTGPIDSAG